MAIKTGTYTGDGNATQAIAGVGFAPLHVTIIPQMDTPVAGFLPTKSANEVTADDGLIYREAAGNFVYLDDTVTLDADGFTVGDSTGYTNVVNVNGQVYSYVCIG